MIKIIKIILILIVLLFVIINSITLANRFYLFKHALIGLLSILTVIIVPYIFINIIDYLYSGDTNKWRE